jgi:hypothetical protein
MVDMAGNIMLRIARVMDGWAQWAANPANREMIGKIERLIAVDAGVFAVGGTVALVVAGTSALSTVFVSFAVGGAAALGLAMIAGQDGLKKLADLLVRLGGAITDFINDHPILFSWSEEAQKACEAQQGDPLRQWMHDYCEGHNRGDGGGWFDHLFGHRNGSWFNWDTGLPNLNEHAPGHVQNQSHVPPPSNRGIVIPANPNVDGKPFYETVIEYLTNEMERSQPTVLSSRDTKPHTDIVIST